MQLPQNFTLHQFRVFLTVVQNTGITRAAEVLHLTQPAVSIQLRNFQEQFDIPLFEVKGRKIQITEFGKEIARVCERILEEAGSISDTILNYKGLLAGKLRISSVSTGKYVMPYFLEGFLKKHPGIELKMDVTNKAMVMKNLEENTIDFALVSVLPDDLEFINEPLLRNKLFLVGKSNHSYRSGPYQKDLLQNIPLIFRENGSGTRLVMEVYFREMGIFPRKKLELTSNEAVKQAVLAGLGYSVMPLIGLRNELQNGQIEIIPVEGFPIQSEWNLVWRKDKVLSPAALGYLSYIRLEKESILAQHFSEA